MAWIMVVFWDKDDAAFFGKNGELSVKRDYINGLRLFILDFECSTSVHTSMYMYRLEFFNKPIRSRHFGMVNIRIKLANISAACY